MKTFDGFIDPPTPWSSLAEWREFLAEMKKIKPRTDDIRGLIVEAEKMVKELGGELGG